MKKIATGFLLLLALVAQFAFGQPVPIASSKHNLSATTTNTIRAAAGGTTEICVFCHTPHGASTSVSQLWNRAVPAANTYTLYGSTYLIGLSYPTPALGGIGDSSRLCLSCHDGTLALGTVNNTPGSGTTGTITMVGGALPAATNLTANLADDHPVGYQYKPGVAAGQDPELVVRATFPWPKGVQLDPNTATGTVECKSCHDPHDNQFTKFVRMQITDASPTPTTPASPYLCKYCHNKTNYDLSGHATSTQAYVPILGSIANTVQKNGCLACHKSHTATGPILRYTEEATCYNAGCHGTNNPITGNTTAASGTTWRNIQNEMNKVNPAGPPWRAHPTNTITGKHLDKPFVAGTGAETQADLGLGNLANRHAECPDCHNPHQVQPAATVEKSTRGAIRISLALKGMWGVQPSWPLPSTTLPNNKVAFATGETYTVLGRSGTADVPPLVTDEYQVCMKCHSNYVTLPLGARNLAQEINPGNSSYHGIVPGGTTNFFVNSTTMAQPWGGTAVFVANTGTLTLPSVGSTEYIRQNPGTAPASYASRGRVWCSDCHGSELSTMPPAAGVKAAPYGPHGSTLTGIAPGTSNSDRMLVRSIASNGVYTPLCLGCHKPASYSTGNTGSRMGSHAGRGSYATNGCFTCHMWESANVVTGASDDIFPHGMNKRWTTIGTTATAGSLQMVDAFVGGSSQTNGNYTTKQCWTAATIAGGTVNCGRTAQTY